MERLVLPRVTKTASWSMCFQPLDAFSSQLAQPLWGRIGWKKKNVGLYLSTRLHIVIYRHINLFSFFFLPSFQRFALTLQSSFYGGIEELPHSWKTKKTHVLLTRPITPVWPASHEQQTQPFVGHNAGVFAWLPTCTCVHTHHPAGWRRHLVCTHHAVQHIPI